VALLKQIEHASVTLQHADVPTARVEQRQSVYGRRWIAAGLIFLLPVVMTALPAPAGAAAGLFRHAIGMEQTIIYNIAVFGADDRRPLSGRLNGLRSSIGVLTNTSSKAVCTAFCVATDIIATAGHCISGTADNSRPRAEDFVFRLDRSHVRAVGVSGAQNGNASLNILTGTARLNTHPPINATSDWALLRLAANACRAGGLPLSKLSAGGVLEKARRGEVYHVAYHRDLPHWEPASALSCHLLSEPEAGDPKVLAHDFERHDELLLHTCDTEAASSGSPLLIQGADGPEVVGINVGTYVRSRVITHDGRIVQRLETKAVANTAVLASTLIPQRDAFASIGKITLTRRDDITRLQQYLADAGMTPGPVDGLFGEKTRAAVVAYQSKIGHTATGLPTLPLLQRLEMTAGSTAAK